MRNFLNIAVSGQLLKWMLLFVAYHCFTSVNAQQQVTFDPVYYNITTEHGLPSLETYSVKQDSKGYIWICTDAGVCRYDGFNFKTFTVADGLTDNVVFDTYEDYKGRIWFVTYNSLLCYYENGKIKKYKYNHKIAQFVKEQVTSKALIIDSNDNVYYSLRFLGMYKIDKSGSYKQLHENPYCYYTKIIEGNGLISIRMDERRVVKSGVENLSVNGRRPKGERTTKSTTTAFFFPSKEYNPSNNFILFSDCIYDIHRNEIIFHGDQLISFKIIDSVCWICTLNGLIRAEFLSNGQLKENQTFFNNNQFTNITKINDFYIMSTINNGILVCEDFQFLKANVTNGLIDGEIFSITKLNNELIISTSSSIQNLASNQISDLNIPQKSSKRLITFKDRLIVFSSHHGRKNVNYSNEFCSKLTLIGYARDYKIIDDKLFWCSDGITETNVKKLTQKVHYNSWDDFSPYRQRFINSFTFLPTGQLIIGCNDGLFEVKKGILNPYNVGITDLNVVSLEYNNRWGLIIGTSDEGVITIKNGINSHFDLSSGLLADKVNTISVYDDLIFVGTGNGLNILMLKNGQIQNLCYSKNNFHENLDVNTIYVDNDWIYLGTNSGLVKLKKGSLLKKARHRSPNVYLEEVLFDGNKKHPNKKIVFHYDEQLLQLKFSVLQFDNWFSKNYQYRLGKTGQWIDLESPSISLFRPSGEFDVEIRYMNADFQWSLPVKLCHVDVLVPFWMKWYFWGAIASIILFLLFRVYQRRQLRIQEKLIQETQMLSLEQQMQNARMNPHFIFNVFNSIHSFMLQQNIDEAEKYLERFSKLLREILSNSSEGTIPLLAEKSILNKYLELEQLRFKHSFEYEVNVPIELQELKIPSMLIQPFVENAVLYSDKSSLFKKSMIKVDVSLKNERCIEVIVLNSGLISAENLAKIERSSIKNAIGITKKRLDNYNKLYEINDFSLSVKIIDNEFTVIGLKIPIIDEK